jgi:hypothetical protein
LTALTTANNDSFNTYSDDKSTSSFEGSGARTKAGQALLAAKSPKGSNGFVKGTQISIPALSFDMNSDEGSVQSDAPITKVKDSLTPAQLQVLKHGNTYICNVEHNIFVFNSSRITYMLIFETAHHNYN